MLSEVLGIYTDGESPTIKYTRKNGYRIDKMMPLKAASVALSSTSLKKMDQMYEH